jgi:hypothetical protein
MIKSELNIFINALKILKLILNNAAYMEQTKIYG